MREKYISGTTDDVAGTLDSTMMVASMSDDSVYLKSRFSDHAYNALEKRFLETLGLNYRVTWFYSFR